MTSVRAIATAAASLLVVAVAGCGVGEGERDVGTAALTVTRDYGAETLLEATETDPVASETVVRLLDREADIETSYGGNFVESIDTVSGRIEDGRSEDWFFYVNGYWSPIGAGEARVRAGDRIWWDYRDWTEAYRVSAVVGSWPEPFLHGNEEEQAETEVVCFDEATACAEVAQRLTAEGVTVTETEAGAEASDGRRSLRVLVGDWDRVRSDRVAATLEDGPAQSGVYAKPVRCGAGFGLDPLDQRAESGGVLASAGWVAALTRGTEQPTWVVSGTDDEAVSAAAALLDRETLAERYAVASVAGEPQPLPTTEGAELAPAGEESC